MTARCKFEVSGTRVIAQNQRAKPEAWHIDASEALPQLLRISSADMEAAREALAHNKPIAEVASRAGAHAAALPATLRLAALQVELESAIRSSAAQGASDETVDALLAIAVHLSRRFPEV